MQIRRTRGDGLSVWTVAAIALGVVATVVATETAASAQHTRVSVAGDGSQANGASSAPSISGDGRYAVFESVASNLVPNDTNGVADVFLKDLQSGAITRVSTPVGGGAGGGRGGVISTDGRFIVFESTAPLVSQDTNQCEPIGGGAPAPCSDIYVYERATGTLTRVSVSSSGAEGDGPSFGADISGDGRFVGFTSKASNLVTGDTNGALDVFLHDRQNSTTTRVSVTSSGIQNPRPSRGPSISDDGEVIAFLSDAQQELDPSLPSPAGGCLLTIPCERVFVRLRSAGTTKIAPIPENLGSNAALAAVTVSPNGTYIAAKERLSGGHLFGKLFLLNRASGHTHELLPNDTVTIGFSADGRSLAFCGFDPSVHLTMIDLVTQISEVIPGAAGECGPLAVTTDGLLILFQSTNSTLVPLDTNNAQDIFAFDRDTDDDGMPNAWETFFGLDPAGPGDATIDSDGDGVNNLQEFLAGSHPKGTFKRYLAEGATNSFFETTISLLLPGDVSTTQRAAVTVRYLGANGKTVSQSLTLTQGRVRELQPTPLNHIATRAHFNSTEPGAVLQPLPDESFSTVVESDKLLVVERTMTWHRAIPNVGLHMLGSHGESGIAEPRTTWYLAEGATHGPFDLFYLVQNPQNVDTQLMVTYLLPAPQALIVRTYVVPAHSRLTIWVDAEPGLGATDVSAQFTATQPVFVERAMYLSTPGDAFAGGHDGAGIAEPLTQWFVAESVTGGFFDSFLLVGNPNSTDAALTISYFLEDGTTFDKTYVARARSRLTIGLDADDPRLANTSLSALVRSTNSVPVVVERATFWPQGQWYEGHLTSATATAGRKWGMAHGPIFPSIGTITYLLIANPSATAGTATIKLADGFDPTVCNTTVTLPAHSRVTVDIADACGIRTTNGVRIMAGTVESNGPDIIVERASYDSEFLGLTTTFWALGESVALTKLP